MVGEKIGRIQMNINVSEKLTQQQLLEVVMSICKKSEEFRTMKVNESIYEIRQQIIAYIQD